MSVDQQINMFTQQAIWLEAEMARELNRARPRNRWLTEIQVRNRQLCREFDRFMAGCEL